MADATITMNEGALKNLLKTPEGPTGRYIDRKARELMQLILIGASGRPGPEIRTGDLLRNTRYLGIRSEGSEMSAVIASSAVHRGFNYPQAQELGGFTPSGAYYRYPFLNPAFVRVFGAPVAP